MAISTMLAFFLWKNNVYAFSFQFIFTRMDEYSIFFDIKSKYLNNLIFVSYPKIIEKKNEQSFRRAFYESRILYSGKLYEPLVSVRKHTEKRARDAGNKTRTYMEDGNREE